MPPCFLDDGSNGVSLGPFLWVSALRHAVSLLVTPLGTAVQDQRRERYLSPKRTTAELTSSYGRFKTHQHHGHRCCTALDPISCADFPGDEGDAEDFLREAELFQIFSCSRWQIPW